MLKTYLRLRIVLVLLLLLLIILNSIFLEGYKEIIVTIIILASAIVTSRMRDLFNKLGEGSIELVYVDENGEEVDYADDSEISVSDKPYEPENKKK